MFGFAAATEASRYAGKAEEAFNLALDYFSSADDVYHQVRSGARHNTVLLLLCEG